MPYTKKELIDLFFLGTSIDPFIMIEKKSLNSAKKKKKKKNNHCETNLYQCTLEGIYVQLTVTSKEFFHLKKKAWVY